MEVRPLLAVAPVLEEASLHAVQMDAMAEHARLLQRVFHHMLVDVLVLLAHLHVLMLMNEGVAYHVMHLLPVFCLPYHTQLWACGFLKRTFQSIVNVAINIVIARIVCSWKIFKVDYFVLELDASFKFAGSIALSNLWVCCSLAWFGYSYSESCACWAIVNSGY